MSPATPHCHVFRCVLLLPRGLCCKLSFWCPPQNQWPQKRAFIHGRPPSLLLTGGTALNWIDPWSPLGQAHYEHSSEALALRTFPLPTGLGRLLPSNRRYTARTVLPNSGLYRRTARLQPGGRGGLSSKRALAPHAASTFANSVCSLNWTTIRTCVFFVRHVPTCTRALHNKLTTNTPVRLSLCGLFLFLLAWVGFSRRTDGTLPALYCRTAACTDEQRVFSHLRALFPPLCACSVRGLPPSPRTGSAHGRLLSKRFGFLALQAPELRKFSREIPSDRLAAKVTLWKERCNDLEATQVQKAPNSLVKEGSLEYPFCKECSAATLSTKQKTCPFTT